MLKRDLGGIVVSKRRWIAAGRALAARAQEDNRPAVTVTMSEAKTVAYYKANQDERKAKPEPAQATEGKPDAKRGAQTKKPQN